LVVEDQEDVRSFVVKALTSHGYRVIQKMRNQIFFHPLDLVGLPYRKMNGWPRPRCWPAKASVNREFVVWLKITQPWTVGYPQKNLQ
jgi:hypothetical protein